ncbi:MAG: methionyl-tRNA formyltransferase [Pirellulaceae bacterium]
MKILMFGTGPFAVPTFEALLESSSHEIIGLVTRPIDDAGKRRKSAANPMRDLAEQRELPVRAPADCNASEFVEQLKQLQADLFIVCDYGQILSNDCLDSARLGGINLHGSLLPKYRGAAPINWAIYRGESETGISVIHMTSKLDGGPVLTNAALPIRAEDTTESLEPRLSQLGVQPVLDAINILENWDGASVIGQLQDPAMATSARRLRKDDALIRWDRSAKQISNQIRAFQPWPNSYTTWQRDDAKEPLRLIISRVEVEDCNDSHPPGTVVRCDGQQLTVRTGQGCLRILEVQPAGKKSMPIDAFLRGYPLKQGDRLGD